MAVRPGYRQTEVGAIPKDWAVDSLRNLAVITTGARNTQDKVEDGQYPFFVRSPEVERINTYSFDGQAVLTAGDGVGTGKVFHYIKGKFDTVVRFEDGSYGVVDFKTSTPNPTYLAFYGRHVHIYAYALEHAEVGKFPLSPISRLGVQFSVVADRKSARNGNNADDVQISRLIYTTSQRRGQKR